MPELDDDFSFWDGSSRGTVLKLDHIRAMLRAFKAAGAQPPSDCGECGERLAGPLCERCFSRSIMAQWN
jgi:hypothetical protein